MNRLKLFIIGFLLSSLFGYIEWGNNQSMFIFQMEYELFFGSKGSLNSFLHPFIALPLLGQFILIFQLFLVTPKRRWMLLGASLIALLYLLYFAVGIVTLKYKIVISTLPFLFFYVVLLLKKTNQ